MNDLLERQSDMKWFKQRRLFFERYWQYALSFLPNGKIIEFICFRSGDKLVLQVHDNNNKKVRESKGKQMNIMKLIVYCESH